MGVLDCSFESGLCQWHHDLLHNLAAPWAAVAESSSSTGTHLCIVTNGQAQSARIHSTNVPFKSKFAPRSRCLTFAYQLKNAGKLSRLLKPKG